MTLGEGTGADRSDPAADIIIWLGELDHGKPSRGRRGPVFPLNYCFFFSLPSLLDCFKLQRTGCTVYMNIKETD